MKKLTLCNEVEQNEYMSTQDLFKIKEDLFNFFTKEMNKSEEIVQNYLDYTYKTYDTLKFVSLMLITLDNQPYFIAEAFYNKDKSKIFMRGEYKKQPYNFVLE